MQYEVTIGIPLYRAVDFIEQTLLSALNQSFPNIEFLVVDDCGRDGSIQVVEQLKREHPRGQEIRLLYNKENFGVGATRNRIIDEALGDYLYFLDSDDLVKPETIQLLIDKAKEFKAEVVYGSLDRVDKVNSSETQSFILPDRKLLSEDEMALFAFQNYDGFQISACNCLINLEFLRKNQLRFIDAEFWEDLAFTYEMVTKVSRAVLISDITYHYICRPGSLSHYQERDQLDKAEVQKNIQTIDYLKDKCKALTNKPYLPYLTKNLEMNSFYIACHIIKHAHRIEPKFSNQEIQNVLHHPLSFWEIIKHHPLVFPNFFLWLLGQMPSSIFVPTIRLLGKLKKTI